MRSLVLIGLILSLVACGDDTEDLTCEMFEDPNFCWNARAAEARACTEDVRDDSAVSTDDGMTCDYPDSDVRVDFNRQIPADSAFDEITLDFSIEKDGEHCMTFREEGENQVLETPSGTARIVGEGTKYVLECDGTTFEASAFKLLDECELGNLPGHTWSHSSGGFNVGLQPSLNDESQGLLSCNYE